MSGPRKRCSAFCLLMAAGIAFLLAACDAQRPQRSALEVTGAAMGTTYHVTVVGLPAGVAPQQVRAGLAGLIAKVDELMSTYRSDSDVSRFNASLTTDWVAVAPETRAVVEEALRVSRLTGGAFDVTVGPLVDLWGFGPTVRGPAVPTEDRITRELQRIGYAHLETRADPDAIRKGRQDVHVDLSAIAKGYAVDRAAEHLEALGIGNYLVEIGGELRAKGMNPSGVPWRVAVESPVPERRAVFRVIQVDGAGLATSGDYRNFFEADGRRYSHTIDPRTGRPVEHTLVSVTVVNPSTMFADAMATALVALGPEEGFELAQGVKLAALFIIREAGGLQERSTDSFEQYLLEQPEQ